MRETWVSSSNENEEICCLIRENLNWYLGINLVAEGVLSYIHPQ
ncbi:hypothetical protein AM1_G0055 (plasmid) [Acaryochloris marina MBIC11017]|uniref:Uncharacterized protein n=1 Tax=Acaryochloris marina (strain MBIC 11017) TaxID=329726 RepID=A8ZQE8_ACAM1|nr:hypothetical protein AM1_G0055 [Acaryochloris marina MBIC11017]